MLPSLAEWIAHLQPDVREVGDRQDVHHAPGLVHRIADQLAADRGADAAARAVAADDVLGPDRRDLAGRLAALRCATVTVTGYSGRRSASISMSVACSP